MRVLIIGGHGKVARLLTPELTARSHTVSAVVRNPDHAPEVAADGAQPVVADVESMTTPQLARLVEGYDALVWSAGAGGGDPRRTYAVDRDAATRSMDAAEEAGVRRYVMVSYFGAGPEHGVPQEDPFFPYADAKSAADAHLQASGLEWTLVRPSRLTDEAGTGRIETSRTGATPGEVPRADVALVVAEALERPGAVRAVLELNTGPTPVADELDALGTP
ncbi:SDR family oxidoreductase [Phycicoccus endophyticus]|uniref:SDR family oxidoreductase n=1 Tax=Phycicoccus endophyticus TaxID=1690220 RepID=A0A7G9R0L0_9MICO|nr:SDR family oxidoreductase [Phycicoccus endophyticus]NHI19414.1 SDR family oxidoreductase [Phycicoccus endophyticus]QNN49135.1 SDR family oxidoreductase [Phycicoccus endophyticus]GGL38899.1 NAD-dependent dehydratase [Phycicoccus endophyticus]